MRYLSLFSGIEAATQAWHPLGWEPVAFAEIEPFPASVLAHHYPDVPNLGDVTAITEQAVQDLGRIDIVVGGSPCQDLSVAGKRLGLGGARSGLFHHQLRIFHAARRFCGARWLLWENVPGAFSVNAGGDFAVVVSEMAGSRVPVPGQGWGTEGVALGRHGLLEWAVLDAQWFGVAQRRRRVFALLDTGDWANRPPVLLEPASLRGDSPPSRKAGEGTAVSPALRAQAHSSHGADAEAFIPEVSPALKARDYKGPSSDGVGDGATLIAHALRGDGFDASEDGTGRGTPLVAVPHVDVLPTMQNGADTPAGHSARSGHTRDAYIVPMGFNARQDLDCWINRTGPIDTDGSAQAVAFAQNQRDEVRLMDAAGALAAEPGAKQQTYIASIAIRGRGDGRNIEANESGVANALLTPNGGRDGIGPGAVWHAIAVRRLTPRECERLQGFPDDYTLIPYRGKPAKDGPRYKALGNSMAVPVMGWIARKIEEATRG